MAISACFGSGQLSSRSCHGQPLVIFQSDGAIGLIEQLDRSRRSAVESFSGRACDNAHGVRNLFKLLDYVVIIRNQGAVVRPVDELHRFVAWEIAKLGASRV